MVTFKKTPVRLSGTPLTPGEKAPPFLLVDRDLKDRSLKEFQEKKKLLATVPSLDTGTCATMTKRCNAFAQKHPEIILLVISADLPFAQKRFCEKEGVQNSLTLSMMRDKSFAQDYGLLIDEGPLKGLLTRSLFVLDEKDQIVYLEIVGEITEEPHYEEAFRSFG